MNKYVLIAVHATEKPIEIGQYVGDWNYITDKTKKLSALLQDGWIITAKLVN